MSAKPETRFTQKVRALLDERLPGAYFVKIQQVALRGVPDLLGVVAGRFVALEIKVGTNKPSALQSFVIEKIQKAGGYAVVLTPENLEEVMEELKWIHKTHRS